MPSPSAPFAKRVAIVGGGIAGLTATWQVAQLAHGGAAVEATLFEATPRFGGTVETVHRRGFVVECGPDGWLSEKPWARDLAIELGLGGQLLPSLDTTRKTHILLDGRLQTMPDGMRMMVPTDLEALDQSTLFSPSAKQAYRDEITRAPELRAAAPQQDETIADFTLRHFGQEVLDRIAAPLLSGVLGGDVHSLSVQAVLPQFVSMERAHGSLIAALQSRTRAGQSATRSGIPDPSVSIFTSLSTGLGTLIERLVAGIPSPWLRPSCPVHEIIRSSNGWLLATDKATEAFDELILATPAQVTRDLLDPVDTKAADLLRLDATSAIVIAFAYSGSEPLQLPPGFGFLVPPGSGSPLLACTFVDQKFPHRVPAGARLIRAFFGASAADSLMRHSDDHLAALAQQELTGILGNLPSPAFTLVRRWPRSLPQYAVGHLTRMESLDRRLAAIPSLALLGNTYRGVGLPDLIRDARRAANSIVRKGL